MNFKDATSTAQATVYFEEKACEVANDATDLSNHKIFLKEVSRLYILV